MEALDPCPMMKTLERRVANSRSSISLRVSERKKNENWLELAQIMSKRLRNSPNVYDIVTSEVAFLVDDAAYTTLVTTTGEHDKLTLLEGDNLDNLVLQEVKLDRVGKSSAIVIYITRSSPRE